MGRELKTQEPSGWPLADEPANDRKRGAEDRPQKRRHPLSDQAAARFAELIGPLEARAGGSTSPRLEEKQLLRFAEEHGLTFDTGSTRQLELHVKVGDVRLGTLTIDFEALEHFVIEGCKRVGIQDELAVKQLVPTLSAFALDQIEQHLSQWFDDQLAFLPDVFWAAAKPDYLLKTLSDASPEIAEGLLSIPSVWATVHRLGRVGSQHERRRIKKILNRLSPLHPGRPVTEIGERSDVLLTKEVDDAVLRLREGFEVARARRRSGGFASDREQIAIDLRRLGHDGLEIDAILNAQTPLGAATRLIAAMHHMHYRTVGAAVSRGRRLLRTR